MKPVNNGEENVDDEKGRPIEFMQGPRLVGTTTKIIEKAKEYFPKKKLLTVVREHQITILQCEAGSGTMTQIPQYLHEAGFTNDGKKIACIQPNRAVALLVARRVTAEMGVKLGDEVGYNVPFQESTSERTVIKYMTDVTLLHELLPDPYLDSYSVIVFDEAHNRTQHTDILFGLVKDIVRLRPGLKLLISAITVDAERLSIFFGEAPIFKTPERFPIDPSIQLNTSRIRSMDIITSAFRRSEVTIRRQWGNRHAKKYRNLAREKPYKLQSPERIDCIKRLELEERTITPLAKREMIEETKKSLPIYPFKEKLVTTIREHQILVLQGETGSGNTTQLTQYLSLSLMQVYNQWAESDYSKQWCSESYIHFRSMERARDIREKLVELTQNDTTNIRKAIIAGYFYHVARLSKDVQYKIVKHQETVKMHPNAILFEQRPPLVLYQELVFRKSNFMRFLTEVSALDLLELAPHYYRPNEMINSIYKNLLKNVRYIHFIEAKDEQGKAAIMESQKKKMTTDETKKSFEDLITNIHKSEIIMVQGETGSVQTIQIPLYLHQAGFTINGKKIGCIFPHAVNVMSAAAYVAEKMRVELGNEVGYSIPFEDCTSQRTVIKYMTDDTLLREMLSDHYLVSYSVIIIEVHKRTLQTDILLGLLKIMAHSRSVPKLLIVSQVHDLDKLSNFFNGAQICRLLGRHYRVNTFYTKQPVPDYIDACVDSVLQIHAMQPPGDILVFLTRQEEIEACQEMLQDQIKQHGSNVKELVILSMYENISSDILRKTFEPTPPNTRKVVLATHIAETSLAIDNIMYVIDSGFEKQHNFNSRSGLEMLMNVPISKASANRRACLAGLVGPGKCFRLYTAEDYENLLKEHTIPEIKRMNLSNVVLTLNALGINDLLHFDFLEPPPRKALELALNQLYALGALNDRGNLTRLGRQMVDFPVESMMAKMVLASEKYNCSEEIVTIAAMLLVKDAIFSHHKDADNARKKFHHLDGDHLSLMQVYNQWAESGYSEQWCSENYIKFRSMERARNIRDKLVGLMQKVGIKMVSALPDTKNILRAIIAGYFYHVARRSNSQNYKLVKHDKTVLIQPKSTLFAKQPRLVLYHELVFTTREFMRLVIEIDPIELLEVAPHYYKLQEFIRFGRTSVQQVGLHEFFTFY